jgi:uncharacterized protein (DUF1697 family)
LTEINLSDILISKFSFYSWIFVLYYHNFSNYGSWNPTQIQEEAEKRSQQVGQERKAFMEDRIKDLLEKIKRTAEIILEHQSSRAFKNSIITLGAESIIAMCDEAIGDLEQEKKEG